MKLVCVSDTHSLHNELEIPDGDILIHTGDITRSGEIDSLLNFNEWLAKQPHEFKVVIGGNHDRRTKEVLGKIITNGIYLNNTSIEINGLVFWGSPYTPAIGEFENYWAFSPERGGYELRDIWNAIPNDTDILLTHGPPHGILDQTKSGYYVGCELLIGKIIKVKPKLHIFGHIHEGYGIYRARYGTTFVNCSVVDENYNLKNKPVEVYA